MIVNKDQSHNWKFVTAFAASFLVIHLSSCYPSNGYQDYMRFYAATRDYIQKDTSALIYLQRADPFKAWVCEESICFDGISYWDIPGWLEWMNIQWKNQEDLRRIEDSLARHVKITPCTVAKDPDLQKLSTTSNREYAVIFMQIDSTVLPGNYIVAAYLYHNPDQSSSPGKISFMKAGLSYCLVFDRHVRIKKEFHGPVVND